MKLNIWYRRFDWYAVARTLALIMCCLSWGMITGMGIAWVLLKLAGK